MVYTLPPSVKHGSAAATWNPVTALYRLGKCILLMSLRAEPGIMYAEDIVMKTKTLKAAFLALIAICLATSVHAQDYQPPELYKDTATLQTYLDQHPELVRARFQDDLTLLHFAAINGDTTGARLILDKGGKVNAVDKFGRTPLHMVRLLGITELLLSRGADVTIKDKSGAMPFETAFAAHRNVAARALAKDTIFPAVAKSDLRTIQRIVYAYPEAVSAKDKDGATPLHFAAADGSKVICEMLISAGADPNAKKRDGVTPLHVAAGLGRTDVVRLLLDKGADPKTKDGKGRTALGIAIERGQKAAAQVLVSAMEGAPTSTASGKRSASVDKAQAVRALFLAVMQDDIAGTKRMLKRDPGLAKAADASGMTALMVAIDAGKNEIATQFINAGADVNASDDNGLTPLFRAVDDLDLARLLIEKGARVTARCRNQRTPLHEVACFGTNEVAEFLISKGADVNATDSDGKTPLALAVRSGTRPAMVALLTQHGGRQ